MDKFPVIYSDPPWSFENWGERGDKRSAANHYQTQDEDWICALPVEAVAAKDCVLLMWATAPNLEHAMRVIAAWGFTYKTFGFSWIKTTKAGTPAMGCGYWTRANAEVCLLATRGKPKRVSAAVHQAILAPRGRHSAKPPEIRDRIEKLLDGPYLEMFCRPVDGVVPVRDNWTFLGNEITGNSMEIDLRVLAGEQPVTQLSLLDFAEAA